MASEPKIHEQRRGEGVREGQFDVGVELTEPRQEFWGIRFPPPERVAS